jgi:hypothetical protein
MEPDSGAKERALLQHASIFAPWSLALPAPKKQRSAARKVNEPTLPDEARRSFPLLLVSVLPLGMRRPGGRATRRVQPILRRSDQRPSSLLIAPGLVGSPVVTFAPTEPVLSRPGAVPKRSSGPSIDGSMLRSGPDSERCGAGRDRRWADRSRPVEQQHQPSKAEPWWYRMGAGGSRS